MLIQVFLDGCKLVFPLLFCVFTALFGLQVVGMQVHANEGGVTQTRGGAYWLILPAGCNTFFCG